MLLVDPTRLCEYLTLIEYVMSNILTDFLYLAAMWARRTASVSGHSLCMVTTSDLQRSNAVLLPSSTDASIALLVCC